MWIASDRGSRAHPAMSMRGIADPPSAPHGLDHRGCTIRRLDPRPHQRGAQGRSFFEKIPEPRRLDHVVRRQDRADEIRLRRGVNFIQAALRFA
jgi:hypothetical protein